MQKSKLQFKIKNFYLFALFFVLFVFFNILPLRGQAVELYLEFSQPEYAPNEIFSVKIRLNVTPPENVTAIEGYLKFDNQSLKAIDFLSGNSVLMFIEPPKINQEQGIVSFSGIIPGGYTGSLIGDPGESNLLGTIVFQSLKPIKPRTIIYFLNNSRILFNEGEEFKNNIVFKPLEININSQKIVLNPLNELEKIKVIDKIPPEEFKPEIVKINNQYFLVFNTQDKQSGIDHYEVATFKENLLAQPILVSNFEKSESPYPLNKDDLNKIIEVKAIDKVGNERIAILYPQKQIKWYKNYWLWGIIGIGSMIYIMKIISRKFRRE